MNYQVYMQPVFSCSVVNYVIWIRKNALADSCEQMVFWRQDPTWYLLPGHRFSVLLCTNIMDYFYNLTRFALEDMLINWLRGPRLVCRGIMRTWTFGSGKVWSLMQALACFIPMLKYCSLLAVRSTKALEAYPIAGKRVLIVGSNIPWYEYCVFVT